MRAAIQIRAVWRGARQPFRDLAGATRGVVRYFRAHRELRAARAQIEALQQLAGCAYVALGVHDAPNCWLDALSDAACGRPFSADELLPYTPDSVCEAERKLEALDVRLSVMRAAISSVAARFRRADPAAQPARAHITRAEMDAILTACAPLRPTTLVGAMLSVPEPPADEEPEALAPVTLEAAVSRLAAKWEAESQALLLGLHPSDEMGEFRHTWTRTRSAALQGCADEVRAQIAAAAVFGGDRS